jgi:hypothetical protein
VQSQEKVLFVTASQLGEAAPQLEYARDDGYRLVTVPDDIARRLASITDLSGRPMVDLGRYQEEYNESFSYTIVDESTLTPGERAVFERTATLLNLVGCRVGSGTVKEVMISETMRLSSVGDMVLGVWESNAGRIIIRRSELATTARFAATLLHEYVHARYGHDDRTLDFEHDLSIALGNVASNIVGA